MTGGTGDGFPYVQPRPQYAQTSTCEAERTSEDPEKCGLIGRFFRD